MTDTTTQQAAPRCARPGLRLDLSFRKAADQALRELAEDRQLAKVEVLCLTGSAVSAVGLRRLRSAPALRELNLSFTPLTDAGLKQVALIPGLTNLNLWGTRVTSEGLARFRGHASLRVLVLKETAADDAALSHLQKVATLRRLNLMETAVTERGVRRLQAALPEISVLW